MVAERSQGGLELELTRAIDELRGALDRAGEATASIKSLLPSVAAIGPMLDRLEAAIRSGREQIGGMPEAGVAREEAA